MKGSQVGSCHNGDNCEEDGEGRHQSPGRVRRVHLVTVVCCAPGLVKATSVNHIAKIPFVNIPMDLQAGPWQGLVSVAAVTVPHGDIPFHAISIDFANES